MEASQRSYLRLLKEHFLEPLQESGIATASDLEAWKRLDSFHQGLSARDNLTAEELGTELLLGSGFMAYEVLTTSLIDIFTRAAASPEVLPAHEATVAPLAQGLSLGQLVELIIGQLGYYEIVLHSGAIEEEEIAEDCKKISFSTF